MDVCFGCDYELTGLGEGRCPECGLGFDALNPSTFASSHSLAKRNRRLRSYEIALIAVGLVPFTANSLGFGALLVARMTLGRWPYRGGWDDPSNVPGVGLLAILAILLVVMSLPAFLTGFFLVIALISHKAWMRLVRSGFLAVGIWAYGFSFTLWDPAEVWMWLWD